MQSLQHFKPASCVPVLALGKCQYPQLECLDGLLSKHLCREGIGKNVLVRSLSGIGQAGSLFLGQGSLNQPLSESDLMRERAASNIGKTGDEEVSRLAVNQQIVVTVPAGIPIYVVLQQTPKSNQAPAVSGLRGVPTASKANSDQLRQLLQLQQELNQTTGSNPSAQ